MIAIILNPIAGGASARQIRARAEVAARAVGGAPGGEVFVTERKGHAHELARGAAARGATLVVAWGGDGTVNEVGSALAFGSTPMGIVPAGSGNGLARSLGVARQPERALADALAATPRPIDACELGGRLFFSIAGLGFDAHVAACFDRDSRRRRGLATYVRISTREMLRYRPGLYRMDATGDAGPRRLFLVTFANAGQFGNGVCIAPNARVDDGLMDLVVFEERSRMATCLAIPRLLAGRIARVPGIAMRQVNRAIVESDEPMRFHVDGEPVDGGTRLEARIHPGALRMAVR